MSNLIKHGEELIIPLSNGMMIKFSEVKKDAIKTKTIQQAIEKSEISPTLVAVKQSIGEEKLVAVVEVLLVDLIEFFNFKDKMSPKQIEETAILIVADFKNLHLNEIAFILSEAKKGKYGEMYNTINGQKIYSWFSGFFDKRCEYFEQKNMIAQLGDDFERKSTKDGETLNRIYLDHLKTKGKK